MSAMKIDHTFYFTELKNVIRQPANDEANHQYRHHAGHFSSHILSSFASHCSYSLFRRPQPLQYKNVTHRWEQKARCDSLNKQENVTTEQYNEVPVGQDE